jgi:signal transduction histidine kinase
MLNTFRTRCWQGLHFIPRPPLCCGQPLAIDPADQGAHVRSPLPAAGFTGNGYHHYDLDAFALSVPSVRTPIPYFHPNSAMPVWSSPLIAFAATALGFVLIRFWSQRKLKRHVRDLEDEHVRDEERQRIATDVHDDLSADVSNLLLLSRMGLRNSSTGTPGHGELQRIEELSGGMLRKIDEIIWSLDPKSDRWDASIAFIDRYAADMAKQHGLEFRTNTDGVRSPVHLSPPKRRDLYLAAKEVLQNIAEHAGASTVNIVAHTMHGALVLRISDDGHGDRKVSGGGQGLLNIRKRIERWEGSVRVDPALPQGTSVVIALPLDEHHPKG